LTFCDGGEQSEASHDPNRRERSRKN
jgi:hypothetical protein